MSLVATQQEARMASLVRNFVPQIGTGLVPVRHVGAGAGYMVTVQMEFAGGLAQSTGYEAQSWLLRELHTQQSAAVPSIPEMLNTIRAAFGLNVKQLADVLQITRVTVYEWQKVLDSAKLQENNRLRLHHIYGLARFWHCLPAIAGNYLQERIDAFSATLEQMLQGNAINPMLLVAAHTQLMRASNQTARREAALRKQRRALQSAEETILANHQALGVILD